MQRGVGAAPPTPRCYFLLSSTPTIDTEPIKKEVPRARLKADGFPSPFRGIWVAAPEALKTLVFGAFCYPYTKTSDLIPFS